MKRMLAGLLVSTIAWPVYAGENASETWYPVESPTKADLLYIAFAEDGTGFAVGLGGTVLRYDGFAWRILPFPDPTQPLTLVASRNHDDAWVFPRMNNIAFHYAAGRWETKSFDREFSVQAIDFRHPNLGYAVGLFGLMYRFDGEHWERVTAPNLPNDRESHLRGVAVLGPDDVWMNGDQFLLHFDGTTWRRSALPTTKATSSFVQRVGNELVLLGQPPLSYKDSAWRPLGSSSAHQVAGNSQHLWGVASTNGRAGLERLAPPGASWFSRDKMIAGIAQGKDGLWSVGERGLILHLEPNTLPSFLDRTFDAGAGVQSESSFALFADIDGVGTRDLVLTKPFGRNSFLRADEGGTFRPMPLVSPQINQLPNVMQAAIVDVDGDGWNDLVLRDDVLPGAASMQILRNLGGFRFWNAPVGVRPVDTDGWTVHGNMEVFDFDDDGDLDIYEVRMLSKGGGFPLPNLLHRNDGFGHFRTESLHQRNGGAAWGWTNAVLASDLTADGRTDIFALNSWGSGNMLYAKTADGTFIEVTEASGLAGDTHLGLTAISGDIDNDGALDVLVLTSVDFGPSRLYHNDGRGHFHDITTESGIDRVFASAVQAQFADMDLDGDLDLILGNALQRHENVQALGRLRLLVNDGTGRFSDATVKANIDQATTAFVANDFDDDGDIDLYLVRAGESNRLLMNEPPTHGYLKVQLETAAPNRSALGARVSVFGKNGALVGFRETNWREPIAQFGLADLDEVDVEVRFPSGHRVRRSHVATRSQCTITEFSRPVLWLRDSWFFLRHRWAWADGKRDAISLLASLAFLAGLWRLASWLRTRFFVRRKRTMALLWTTFFFVRLAFMPLEPVSTMARGLPLTVLLVLGTALLLWDRRLTNRADARFVGPYELLTEIGRGGMGIVYRARDTSQKGRTIVALKILNPDRVRDPSSLRRFVREADIGAKLNHPGIVAMLASGECRVLDRGTWQSTAYLAMEFVEGTSLAALLTGSDGLPLVRLLEILRDAALALAAAHEEGILHRDVKPDNILLSRGGVVKLVDLGIASVVAAPSQTEMGFLIGTLAYLPPERVMGRNEDTRGDIYSLGVSMYEAVCGRRPFDDRKLSTGELLRAVVEVRPDVPTMLRPDIPARLNTLVLRMLEKNPDERPSSMQAVAQEIENILREMRGEVVVPAAASSTPGLEKPEAHPSSLITTIDCPENEHNTVDMPSPPTVIPAVVAPADDAFQRETLDLPIEPR